MKSLLGWGWLELREGWRSWWGKGRQTGAPGEALPPQPAKSVAATLVPTASAEVRNS
jgi:hypothetical protein